MHNRVRAGFSPSLPTPPYMWVRTNLPRDYIELIKYLFTEVLDGRNSSLTGGVKRALGRESRSFHFYTNATEQTGVWDVLEPVQVNA